MGEREREGRACPPKACRSSVYVIAEEVFAKLIGVSNCPRAARPREAGPFLRGRMSALRS